jgi:hypothetical protein
MRPAIKYIYKGIACPIPLIQGQIREESLIYLSIVQKADPRTSKGYAADPSTVGLKGFYIYYPVFAYPRLSVVAPKELCLDTASMAGFLLR